MIAETILMKLTAQLFHQSRHDNQKTLSHLPDIILIYECQRRSIQIGVFQQSQILSFPSQKEHYNFKNEGWLNLSNDKISL